MKILKDYGILLFKFLLCLVLGSAIISVFYYFLFSSKVVNVISFVYLLLVFFIFGFKGGKKAEAKGFIAGLKIGGLFVLCLFFFHLLFFLSSFKWMSILYYFLLLMACIFGAMAGINTKKE